MKKDTYFNLNKNQTAFIMPSVLIMMIVMSLIAFATLQLVVSTLSVAKKQSYLQIAQSASKSAIDFAKEEFEADENYNGTAETELFDVGDYRVTFEVVVSETSPDGLEKDIQGYGNVYVPDTAVEAQFVRDIKAHIVRRGTVSGNPSDYSPVLWLDASDGDTLLTSDSDYINASADSTKEERNNGWHSIFSWWSNDLEFHRGFILGLQRVGVKFPNIQIPDGVTITNAYIQFQVDETGNSSGITSRIRGIDKDNQSDFIPPFYIGELKNAPLTSASVDWSMPPWNTVGQSGEAQRTPDISALVQEIIDRPGWTSGNSLAFRFRKNGGGNGLRVAEKNPVGLYVEWDGGGGGGALAGDGDPVTQWNDKSGNGNNALLTYGNAPIKRDNEQNGNAAVEFSNDGALRSALTTNINSDAVTAFIVTRPEGGGDTWGRFVTGMNTGQEHDYNNTEGVVFFQRRNTTNNVGTEHNSQYGPVESGGINNTYGIFTSNLFNSGTDYIHRNGNKFELDITNDYNNINEIFVGGRRCDTSPCEYINAHIAEVIVYDYSMTCEQANAIEAYLANKWNITVNENTCPAIPTGPVL